MPLKPINPVFAHTSLIKLTFFTTCFLSKGKGKVNMNARDSEKVDSRFPSLCKEWGLDVQAIFLCSESFGESS